MAHKRHLEVLSFIVNQEAKVGQLQFSLLDEDAERKYLDILSPKAIRDTMASARTPIVKSWLQKILNELLEDNYLIKHKVNSRRIYFTVNENKLIKDFLEYIWSTCWRSEDNKPYLTAKELDELGEMLLASLRTFWACKYIEDVHIASSMSNIYTEILYPMFEDCKEQTYFMKAILRQEKKKKDFIKLYMDINY